MDPAEAIKLIRLPPETIYTIDKVIRLKSKLGPIGIGNSEVINIEMETEFKKKNQYLMNLAEGRRQDFESDEDASEEVRQNAQNEKLLQRLTQKTTQGQPINNDNSDINN
eukprot:CAMPEP_0116882236 /NCGR_PEP_ID=MMETSP0463-20121206/14436_1 /TAXON_ID=181622 /ORGANISM="Strombidinopsis sp, Strain SopsisLIS2011" /LENGTH=109 /DNA_ID=CAMNT_0004535155 /DNA_START=432 /DNA_END=764 /DNA_ORIENTATION=-